MKGIRSTVLISYGDLWQLGKFWKSHLGIAEGISSKPEIFKRVML